MRPSRRRFVAGLFAAGLAPKPTWADAGSPAFLSAAAREDGAFVLCGIDASLRITFQQRLPARGHAAAAHPTKPEAVAFARRPGTFAIVLDCVSGRQRAVLRAPEGRHFYGHGVFCADGRLLFTTENDIETGRGRIGVWDAVQGYRRVADWDSGGIGPHDIKRLPLSGHLVVANGGIETHPDSGRTKLNIPTMRPNLAYLEAGTVTETAELPPEMRKNSIRHLAVSDTGQVAFGMQWQGVGTAPPLVGQHRRGEEITLVRASAAQRHPMQGYVGSIAYAQGGKTLVATSPRGGRVQIYDVASGDLWRSLPIEDVSGVAPTKAGVLLSAGTGALIELRSGQPTSRQEPLRWDNHLVAL